jgi:hypothetical protein
VKVRNSSRTEEIAGRPGPLAMMDCAKVATLFEEAGEALR